MALPREQWEAFGIKGFANLVASKVTIETQWEFFQLANSATAMLGDQRKSSGGRPDRCGIKIPTKWIQAWRALSH
jgi:hypothetical protein